MILIIILLLLISIIEINTQIPNIVHIIKLDHQEVTNFMFTNLLSIFNKINPSILYIHYLNEPFGNNWEHLKKYPEYYNKIQLVKIKEPIGLFNNIPEDKDYEHRYIIYLFIYLLLLLLLLYYYYFILDQIVFV